MHKHHPAQNQIEEHNGIHRKYLALLGDHGREEPHRSCVLVRFLRVAWICHLPRDDHTTATIESTRRNRRLPQKSVTKETTANGHKQYPKMHTLWKKDLGDGSEKGEVFLVCLHCPS